MNLYVLNNRDKEDKHYQLLKKTFKSVPSYDKFMTDPSYQLFTLIDDANVLIGETLIKTEIDENDNNFISICYSMIDEPYKDNALNTNVLNTIYEYGKVNGFRYINAHVRQTNISQINSFMTCGYVQLEVEKEELPMYTDGDKKFRFLKTINEFLNIKETILFKEIE